jgi:hypothetical protein
MIVYLFETAKSSLSYGSAIKGKILGIEKEYVHFKLLSNGLEIKIPRPEIRAIQEDVNFRT